MDIKTLKVLDLPFLPLMEKENLPKCSGIYFVIGKNDEILYIGRSSNIRSRWLDHHKHHRFKQLADTKIAWFALSDGLLSSELELTLIEQFKPKFNKTKAVSPKVLATFRIEEDKWNDFKKVTTSKGKTASEVLVNFIDSVIADSSSIEELERSVVVDLANRLTQQESAIKELQEQVNGLIERGISKSQ